MMEIESTPSRRVPLRETVRDITAQLAPDELVFIDAVGALSDDEVARRFARGEKPDTLAFGLGQLAVMTSPVVWLALDGAARRFGEKAADGVGHGIRAALRKIMRRRADPVSVPRLTGAQVTEVREMIMKLSTERGLSAKRAMEIADAVALRLALDPEHRPAPGPDHKGPSAAAAPRGAAEGRVPE